MADLEADRRHRRTALLIFLAGLVIALVLLLLTQAHFTALEELMERDVEAGTAALIETIRWFVVLMVVPMAALIGYLARLGVRAIRSGRFPPPGTWMLRENAVVTGRPALIRGWVLALLTLVIALAVAQLAIHLWTLADELARSRDRIEPPPTSGMSREARAQPRQGETGPSSAQPWLRAYASSPAILSSGAGWVEK